MADHLVPAQRSRNMREIRQKDTKPEVLVRKLTHRMGYRFRLHSKGLPGKPDLVFPWRKKIIFVHGCFWHGHKCSGGHIPKSHVQYWSQKLRGNKKRDAANNRKLRALGWRTLIIWECQTENAEKLKIHIQRFLDRKWESKRKPKLI